ncbi:hypothetical protein BZG36_05418 [Bifiguratus adelaidae]|uniref:D-serine dehydratase n=1 Tax=Bifiguratus adelaidae TaxID=1938954 RepID=A0A261XTI9_9FUNG|nr:hypothetical protein BZG36_05418 [Bifiguratus adelaidae]
MAPAFPQTKSIYAIENRFAIPQKEALKRALVGKRLSQVRTPALVVKRKVVEENCKRLGDIAKKAGVKLRCHIKTHKTVEGTELQLVLGDTDAIIVSTLAEANLVIHSHLTEQGILKDAGIPSCVLLGLAPTPDKLDEIIELSKKVDKFQLMIDHVSSLDAVEQFLMDYEKSHGERKKLSTFLKVECGNHRAGVPINYPASLELARRLVASEYVNVTGVYTHAGHSYAARNSQELLTYLQAERDDAVNFKKYLADNGVHIEGVSIGATPTSMATGIATTQIEGVTEIHAGNYLFFDRQQCATGMVTPADCAVSVLARVASQYPDRNTLLLDAGGLAFSKDTTPQGGYADIVEYPHWRLNMISQEHGIVSEIAEGDYATATVGSLVHCIPNHACLTCAAYEYYIVVGEDENVVEDIWVPVRGW